MVFLLCVVPFAASFAQNLPVNAKPRGYNGDWGCVGTSVAEFFVPGLGYLINQEFDKAVVFGGSRWALVSKAVEASEEDDFQENVEDTYKVVDEDDTTHGKEELRLFYNKSTYEYGYYLTYYSNLGLLSIYDFYAHSCQHNTSTYHRLADPINFPHFYDKWYFWVYMAALVAAVSQPSDDSETHIYLGGGLTEQRVKSGIDQYYLVGIGEETFFRGVLQTSFFDSFQNWGWSAGSSRYAGIVASSVIFGAAHQGAGLQASAASAFLFGMLFGLIYQPDPNTFDIITASAVHSWHDLIVSYYAYRHAKYHKVEGEYTDIDNVPVSIRFASLNLNF